MIPATQGCNHPFAYPRLARARHSATRTCLQSGIAAGGDHTCAFTSPGVAMCWGDNGFGQLGNGAIGNPAITPLVTVDASGQPLGGVQKIAAGGAHTCAIGGATAAALCWGDDDDGQLGDGNFPGHCPAVRSGLAGCPSAKAIPVVVLTTGAPLTNVTALAAGGSHVCAIIGGNPPFSGGNVQCWGLDTVGQLGDGQSGAQLFRPNPNDPASTILDAPALAMVSYIRSICPWETLSEYVVFACDDPQATVTQPIPSLSSPQMSAAGAFALSSKAPTARSFLLKLRRSSPPTKLAENSGQTY